MAVINFGGVEEHVITREEFPLEKALETLKNDTIAIATDRAPNYSKKVL